MANEGTAATPGPSHHPEAPNPSPRVIVYKSGYGPSSEQANRSKADVNAESASSDDAFKAFDLRTGGKVGSVVQPPVDFDVLTDQVQKNNILPALIDVMEVNVDGTGYEILAKDPVEKAATPEGELTTAGLTEKEEMDAIRAFFDQPWKDESFGTQRRAMRVDREEMGNAYYELMKNPEGDFIMSRPLASKNVRLVKHDETFTEKVTILRGGSDFELEVEVRPRRYQQALGKNIRWYKEAGFTEMDLHVREGTWHKPEEIEFEDRANELIHFVNQRDAFTPYGLTRWWSNAPSVVGSRRAEEFNLNFFDSGGIPPLLIIVSGGALAENAEKALREQFASMGESAVHTAAVIEAYSTSGSVDKPSNVKVTVERFGSERQKDSMFEGYIANCDSRVQRSFRIPSIFMGMSQDFSFATAVASMMVAEAQVFAPERLDFDEVVNLRIMPLLPNGEKYLYRSKTISMRDATAQLEGLGLIQTFLPPDRFVELVGETIGIPALTLTAEETATALERERLDREARARLPLGGIDRNADGLPDRVQRDAK